MYYANMAQQQLEWKLNLSKYEREPHIFLNGSVWMSKKGR